MIFLALLLLLNFVASVRVSRDCHLANLAFNKCMQSENSSDCETSGLCDEDTTMSMQSENSSDRETCGLLDENTMTPANLSLTDQALWEASHHHHESSE